MPNWCSNRVEVSGPPEDIATFKAFVQGKSDFDFDKVLPMPAELRDTDFGGTTLEDGTYVRVWREVDGKKIPVDTDALLEKYGATNWHDWAVKNWGVKWNTSESDPGLVDESPEYLRYDFDTPWGPPWGVCEELRRRFPTLTITWFYDEPGMAIAGYL